MATCPLAFYGQGTKAGSNAACVLSSLQRGLKAGQARPCCKGEEEDFTSSDDDVPPAFMPEELEQLATQAACCSELRSELKAATRPCCSRSAGTKGLLAGRAVRFSGLGRGMARFRPTDGTVSSPNDCVTALQGPALEEGMARFLQLCWRNGDIVRRLRSEPVRNWRRSEATTIAVPRTKARDWRSMDRIHATIAGGPGTRAGMGVGTSWYMGAGTHGTQVPWVHRTTEHGTEHRYGGVRPRAAARERASGLKEASFGRVRQRRNATLPLLFMYLRLISPGHPAPLDDHPGKIG